MSLKFKEGKFSDIGTRLGQQMGVLVGFMVVAFQGYELSI
jgi:hypothetical protein